LNNTFWRLNGNTGPGHFLGTTDNQPLEFRVEGKPALRLEPFGPGVNIVGGDSSNSVSSGIIGAGILSGGQFNLANRVEGSYSAIGGGWGNTNSGVSSFLGGGVRNVIEGGSFAHGNFIGAGHQNLIGSNASRSVIAGGLLNSIHQDSSYGLIGGGQANAISSGANHAVIAGGSYNTNRGGGGFIGGGIANRAENFDAIVVGGAANVNAGFRAFIGGGEGNSISNGGSYATIGGGIGGINVGYAATIAGGYFNTVTSNSAAIGGGGFNFASGVNSVVAGGSYNRNTGQNAVIGGGERNAIFDSGTYSTIGGGARNVIQTNTFSSTIGGGYENIINIGAFNSIIGGGYTNIIETNAIASTIAGGTFNVVGSSTLLGTISGGTGNKNSGSYATIGGGVGNVISNSGFYATIPGGYANVAAGTVSFAAGYSAKALHYGSFVWNDALGPGFASTADNQFSVRASGGVRFVTGGTGMTLDGVNVLSGIVPSASLSGTYSEAVVFNNSANNFTGNGANLTALNASQLTSGTVPDARLSANVSLLGSSITSGEIADGTIAAADVDAASFNTTFWRTAGNAGTTPGTHFLGTTDNQPLELKVNNQRGLRLEPTAFTDTVNVIGGSARNFVGAGFVGATIGGGGAGNYFGYVYTNRVETDFGTVSGGRANTIQSDAHDATIGGGQENAIQSGSINATVGGGGGNIIQSGGSFTTIGGGLFNLIQSNAIAATIPGGQANSAASYGFAAGRRAKANHTGAFVWADSTDADFASTTANQFAVRATGGVVLSDNTPNISFGTQTRQMLNLLDDRYAIGVQKSTVYFRTDDDSRDNGFAWFRGGRHSDDPQDSGGGGTLMTLTSDGLTVNGVFVSLSDRNRKENFASVNPRDVLAKVMALPITQWNFKGDSATPHVGPMAQDFHAAFGLGTDDKHIATVDADGVALAAIQGLNQKLEEAVQKKDAELQALKQTVMELKAAFNRLDRASRATAVGR
jgi:hypothetical protein